MLADIFNIEISELLHLKSYERFNYGYHSFYYKSYLLEIHGWNKTSDINITIYNISNKISHTDKILELILEKEHFIDFYKYLEKIEYTEDLFDNKFNEIMKSDEFIKSNNYEKELIIEKLKHELIYSDYASIIRKNKINKILIN